MLSSSSIGKLSSKQAQIPKNIWFLIQTFSDFANVAKLRSINKEWKALIEEPALWKFKIAAEVDCDEITIPNFAEDKEHKLARFYASYQAVKTFDKDRARKLFNDLKNFGLNASFKFLDQNCYAPFFLSELKNDDQIAPHLRVHLIIEAAAAANISLLSRLIKKWIKHFNVQVPQDPFYIM